MSTHPQAEMISRADYALTVVPIGILAFIVTDVAHEVIGRGAGYFLAGGKSGILTTTRLIADQKLGEMGSKIFDLGSPAGNLTFAFLAWMAQRLFRRPAPRLRFFLCMVMAFNLFWCLGYLLYCGIVGHGDWYALIQGSQPPWLGRGVLCVAGLLLYFASERLVASELHWIVNGAGGWESRVRSLMLVCYLAGGAIACAGAIFDPYGPSEILNSAALSSLVAAIGLLQVPLFFGRFADKAGVTESNVQRSRAWTLAAVGASAFYVCVLGPGIRF